MSAVVLPSIHEMFPEHLMHAHPHRHSAPLHHPRLTSVPAHRYDAKPYARPVPVPRTTSSPYPALLINAPHASPSPNVKAPSRRPQSPRSTSSSGSRPQSPSSDGDEDSVCRSNLGSRGPSSRKHLCGTCGKQFNRPSSLKIHENTHTGATPYRCPHPGCGRAFNVSSNMRRHLRNHGLGFGAATPATPASPSPSPSSPSSVASSLSDRASRSPILLPSRAVPPPLATVGQYHVPVLPDSAASRGSGYTESDLRTRR